MAISNHTTAKRGLYDMLTSVPFQRGYAEVRKGIPVDYYAYDTVKEQTRYERGRAFSVVDRTPVKTLWICDAMIENFKAAVARKEIV